MGQKQGPPTPAPQWRLGRATRSSFCFRVFNGRPFIRGTAGLRGPDNGTLKSLGGKLHRRGSMIIMTTEPLLCWRRQMGMLGAVEAFHLLLFAL